MVKIYGIKNCDTIKKTLQWLKQRNINFEFVDYKVSKPDEELLKKWSKQFGCLNLINKKGTTWRKLEVKKQTSIINEESAMEIMLEYPSIIKRPVITINDKIKMVGFDANHFIEIFS